ncbi:MAG: DUF5989 family protein [Planctomycetota bacterium]
MRAGTNISKETTPLDPAADRAHSSPLRPRRVRITERLRVVAELAEWVRCERLWWITPVLVALLLLSLVIFLASGSAIAPFFYAIF